MSCRDRGRSSSRVAQPVSLCAYRRVGTDISRSDCLGIAGCPPKGPCATNRHRIRQGPRCYSTRRMAREIDQTLFPGGYFKEFIFFHKASNTLILADTIINIELEKMSEPWRTATKLSGMYHPHGQVFFGMRLPLLLQRRKAKAVLGKSTRGIQTAFFSVMADVSKQTATKSSGGFSESPTASSLPASGLLSLPRTARMRGDVRSNHPEWQLQVKHGPGAMSAQCPDHPQKRPCSGHPRTSQKYQSRHNAMQQISTDLSNYPRSSGLCGPSREQPFPRPPSQLTVALRGIGAPLHSAC